MDKEYKDILELNQRYWYGYQSPLVCILGSDGVGHDNIHPAGQLETACRNASVLYHAAMDFKDELDLKEIEIRELEAIMTPIYNPSEKTKINHRKLVRQRDHLALQYGERMVAFKTFYSHAMKLLPVVKSKYDHIDEALPEIWATRVAYGAMVKNHPLGQELKTAVLTEDQKEKFMDYMKQKQGFPKNLYTPNADNVMGALEGAKEWLKISGSVSELATQEPTQG